MHLMLAKIYPNKNAISEKNYDSRSTHPNNDNIVAESIIGYDLVIFRMFGYV